MIDVARLQRRVGATPDGVAGPATFTVLFAQLGATAPIAAELGLSAAVHCQPAGVMETPLRFAHFLAQLGHESNGFRAMEEYASGADYEGRANLGNNQPGDGVRYKGRGPIQVTGRANYRRYGRMIGIDVERRPELASAPSVGLMLSLAYWSANDLNALADRDDLNGLTRRINGGLNGLADRAARLAKAKLLLA